MLLINIQVLQLWYHLSKNLSYENSFFYYYLNEGVYYEKGNVITTYMYIYVNECMRLYKYICVYWDNWIHVCAHMYRYKDMYCTCLYLYMNVNVNASMLFFSPSNLEHVFAFFPTIIIYVDITSLFRKNRNLFIDNITRNA